MMFDCGTIEMEKKVHQNGRWKIKEQEKWSHYHGNRAIKVSGYDPPTIAWNWSTFPFLIPLFYFPFKAFTWNLWKFHSNVYNINVFEIGSSVWLVNDVPITPMHKWSWKQNSGPLCCQTPLYVKAHLRFPMPTPPKYH